MSSPLSTMRKSRRAPLPGIGPQSDGERKPYKERSDTDYETTLFREIFPQNQPAPLNMSNASRSKVMQKMKTKEASPPSDFELMSSMMQKISQLENKVKAQALDIERKARRISVLEDKLTLLQESKEKSVNNEIKDDGLNKLCLKLQKQVWEMEGLSDGAKSQSTTIVETPVLQALTKSETDCLGKDITTLRVKSEDGVETFIVKMHYSETIGDLRHYLDMKRGPGGCPYDIISAFPKRCYSDDTQTLLSCGLIPNAALILRPQPSSHRKHGNAENDR